MAMVSHLVQQSTWVLRGMLIIYCKRSKISRRPSTVTKIKFPKCESISKIANSLRGLIRAKAVGHIGICSRPSTDVLGIRSRADDHFRRLNHLWSDWRAWQKARYSKEKLRSSTYNEFLPEINHLERQNMSSKFSGIVYESISGSQNKKRGKFHAWSRSIKEKKESSRSERDGEIVSVLSCAFDDPWKSNILESKVSEGRRSPEKRMQ